MPVRHVDGPLLRRVRRAADLTQKDVAEQLGVTVPAVVGWESGKSQPDGERLPALAKAVAMDLDELFPRASPPGLADLRCDAGYYQYETAGITGTRSAGPVANAERGKRRLSERFVPLLADAYGVSAAELLAAQDRSFGAAGGQDGPPPSPTPRHVVGVPAASPPPASSPPASSPRSAQRRRGLAEKIDYLLEQTYVGVDSDVDPRSPDADIAAQADLKACAEVLIEAMVHSLRTGGTQSASDEVLQALAGALAVPPLLFRSDDAEVRRIISGVRLVLGGLAGIAARGSVAELPAELLDFIDEDAAVTEDSTP
ncbi:helix-turn-helix domain-containing protein [Streptomyces sp. NPDC056773]|uniref:helix-turn-helix domain-containing protein n=1 Tax=unclassified Streptomyces TaxID=2593676 RepID=UPI0036761F41